MINSIVELSLSFSRRCNITLLIIFLSKITICIGFPFFLSFKRLTRSFRHTLENVFPDRVVYDPVIYIYLRYLTLENRNQLGSNT